MNEKKTFIKRKGRQHFNNLIRAKIDEMYADYFLKQIMEIGGSIIEIRLAVL